MKYLLKQDLHVKDKTLNAGDMVDAKDIPQKSLKWLLEQEIIVKVDKKMQEQILQEKIKGEEE